MRLVLVGGGHAHLHVLRDLGRRPLAGASVTLVTPEAGQPYTGMLPGFLQGTYTEADLVIDLDRLTRRAGVTLRLARAEAIEPAAGIVRTTGGHVPYDLLSLDVGSVPAGRETPGVDR